MKSSPQAGLGAAWPTHGAQTGSRLPAGRYSGCKGKVSTGQTTQIRQRQHRAAESTAERGRSEPPREPATGGGLEEGGRDLPLPSQLPLFPARGCLGRDAGHRGRRQAWSHRAELLEQSLNPAIPCQAAAEENQEGPSVPGSWC